MGQALFLGIGVGAVCLIHYYVWRRLVRSTTRTAQGRRIGRWIVIALALVLVLTLIGSRLLPHSVAAAVSWPGYLWLAVIFYLVLSLGLLELPALAGRILLRRRASRTPARVEAGVTAGATVGPLSTHSVGLADDPQTDQPTDQATTATAGPDPEDPQSRRLFLARAVAITAGVASVGIVASGVRSAMGPPQLKRIQIPLAKLSRAADGYRIALVSDIHLGPLRGYSHTRRIVDIINGLNADAVTVVGDLVDGSVAELGEAASPLRDLRSKHGSFFVTGNHEYYSGYQEWVDEVASFGVRPLRNEWLELPGGFDLSGVNDVTGESFEDGPDFDKALAGRDPSRAVVMLAHQPIQAFDAVKHGVDLQLSGHTHGGQVAPFNLVVRLAQQPVVSGLGHVDGMPVYVSNGAGFWGPPVRVGAPPDITLVELRAP